MANRKIVEHVELEREQRWTYLKRFYEVASAFYGARDRVVGEEEVQSCIRGFKSRPAPRVRRRYELERWRFVLDEKDEGVGQGYYAEGFDEGSWEQVRLPHSINNVPKQPMRYGRTQYRILAPEAGMWWDIWKGEYASWYKTRVGVGQAGEEQVAYLSFDSVNLLADVWVNEDPVMMGHRGLFPFKMEVTEELNQGRGGEAVIALRVANQATNTPYLFSNGMQLAYANPPYTKGTVPVDTYDEAWSGIAGQASLELMDRRHLEDVFLYTQELLEGQAVVVCRVELRNEGWRGFEGALKLEVGRWFPEEVQSEEVGRQRVRVLPMNEGVVELRFVLREPRLWSVDSPNLYLAHVILLDEQGKEIDDLYESFGVRTIKMQGAHFYLNGKKIVPRGTHDLSNYFGESLICPSDRAIVMDILLHKRMNATCSRWPSDMRMHYKRIAEYADQLGFMISWTGYFEMWTVHPEMEMYARRDVKAMVRSLRNHPSIIVWEMGDEPLMLIHHHRRFRWYEQVYELTAAEDRSRPIIPAGYWSNELVDLIVNHPEQELPVEERRRRVLEEYPLFTKELAPWDFHHCPYLPGSKLRPTYEVIDMVKNALGGERATIFTEFGLDGMPEFEKVKDVYGKFRWTGYGLMPVDRRKSDMNYYGRAVGQEDWRETQAAQAITISGMIGRLRENPQAFAGFYLVTMVDPWTFYWGVVDAKYNAKLAYFAVQGCYGSLYVSGMHGSTVVSKADRRLEITASNFAAAVVGASLQVVVKDEKNRAVEEKRFDDLKIPGNGSVSALGELEIPDGAAGMYSIEYVLAGRSGNELNRRVELFILTE